MEKNTLIFILFFTCCISVFLFAIPKINANDNQISEKIFLDYDITKETEIKNEILKSVLTAANKNTWLKDIENATLNIHYGDIFGETGKDAILIIRLGEKISLLAAYKKETEGEYYTYSDLVDTFFVIKDIQMLQLKENGKDIILVREYANQLIGAYEEGTFIRAYIWDNDKFNLVLNITEDYKSYWNELWDNKKEQQDSRWLKINQSAKVKWENGMYPVLYVLYQQSYSASSSTNQVKLPPDSDFTVIKTKDVHENYYWSSKWKHFVISEGLDIKTSQPVAIIENLSNSPFSLTGKLNENLRIKNKDGKIEIVNKTTIKSK